MHWPPTGRCRRLLSATNHKALNSSGISALSQGLKWRGTFNQRSLP
jgi:hypothetical protein